MTIPHMTIPQCVVDLANAIDWNAIHYSQYEILASRLWKLISGCGLPQSVTITPVTPNTWPLGMAYDVPPVFVNVLLRVDWNHLPAKKQQSLAKQLSAIVFSPLVGLRRRNWT
ncbi:MAG: hypothetical protein ABI876_10500 [Bacteroidota bacterium]